MESEGAILSLSPAPINALVIIYQLCASEQSCSALCLFFTLLTVSFNLHSLSDRTMIDVSRFKIAPPHKWGYCDSRHLRQKQFYGALPLMELRRLILSQMKFAALFCALQTEQNSGRGRTNVSSVLYPLSSNLHPMISEPVSVPSGFPAVFRLRSWVELSLGVRSDSSSDMIII